VGPPDEIPGVGPPDDILGVGPPDDILGVGPPDEIPGVGPPDEIPGVGPPDEIPGVGPGVGIPGIRSSGRGLRRPGGQSSLTRNTARNASCGTSTDPSDFIRFLPFFCLSSSFRFREMSPP
jgi:hypothetical protein